MRKSNKKIIEHDIEQYFIDSVKENGGFCCKFTSPGTSGVPDRIAVLKGYTVFVELKKPGKKPRLLQKIIIKQMKAAGAIVVVIDTKEQVDEFINFFKEKRKKSPINIGDLSSER